MSPKIFNIGFGAQGHVAKSRNHGNEGFEGSPISKSKGYKFKLKQNNTTEFLSISFPQIYNDNCPKLVKRSDMRGLQVFPDWSYLFSDVLIVVPSLCVMHFEGVKPAPTCLRFCETSGMRLGRSGLIPYRKSWTIRENPPF